MADICCKVLSEGEASPPRETSSLSVSRVKLVAGLITTETENGVKRARLEIRPVPACFSSEFEKSNSGEETDSDPENGKTKTKEVRISNRSLVLLDSLPPPLLSNVEVYPKYGVASVRGRRRDMEDAVAVHPSFYRGKHENTTELHYFGVYDGHGCSHVAMKCRDRLHELVKEELENDVETMEWKTAMERSFCRMDKEVVAWNADVSGVDCRCQPQTPDCDAVGSTAVVAIVTPENIVVANCGDSRAVLCRKGKAFPLSSDHKPDRPDELSRIEDAGGRVIYWDCPRVLGVLAMSRAVGDNYLKPYVSCEPEVTITERKPEDECLILASDGLWDVVSNETAVGVARMCLKGKAPKPSSTPRSPERDVGVKNSGNACMEASTLLTKLALARQSSDNVSVVVVDLRKGT